MRTPSLGRRIVVLGSMLVGVLALAFNLLAFVALRASATRGAEAVLEARAAVVRSERAGAGDAAELATRLSELGVEATVRDAAGRWHSGTSRSHAATARATARTIDLGDGMTAVVRGPATSWRWERLAAAQLAVTALLVVLAAFLLRWVSEVALAPLDSVAEAARRTAAGRRGERLSPDRPHTRLGQMAAAYDVMLDALEGSAADARAAQAESERLQRQSSDVLRTASDAFVSMASDGTVRDWNRAASRMFGWTAEEAVGRPVVELIVPTEQREAHLLAVAQAADGRGTLRGEIEVLARRRDGTTFPALVTTWETECGGVRVFSAFVRDLTGQKQAEEATARLAAIVESSDEAIVSTDLDRKVLTWNPGAEKMYGYRAVEAIGRRMSALVGAVDDVRVQHSFDAVRRGEPVQRVEVTRRCKNGTLIDVALTLSPIRDANGSVCGVASVGRDITEQRWMAAQLDATLAALESALDDARRSEARTRRFLDDAAHQLRRPLTSVQACAETLSRQVTEAERERLLSAVVHESARAGRLMSELLRLARLDDGVSLELRETDLVALCRQEAERARREAPLLAVSVVESGDLGLVEVDPHAVAEIVSNLLHNACRHARHAVTVTAGRGDREAWLRVADDGPGLAEEQAECVFERFVTFGAQDGCGLGLPIARELANAHGGTLRYEDRAFVLRIPAQDGRRAAGLAVGAP